MDIYSNSKESVIVSGCAIALLVFSLGRIVFVHVEPLVSARIEPQNAPQVVLNPFSSITLSARAAYVFDIETRAPLFAYNADAQLPLASLTKIMTALIAIEGAGKDSVVVMSKEAVGREGDHGFIVGEKWSVKDLIDATLTTSSNDGAYALASAFVSSGDAGNETRRESLARVMNEKARALGLDQTFFLDEAGLDISEGVSGAYGSARDVARILSYAVRNHPTLMERIRF